MEITLPDQIKLYFDKAGLGNPTFIFIHGGGADNSHLAPQFYFSSCVSRYQASFTLLAYIFRVPSHMDGRTIETLREMEH